VEIEFPEANTSEMEGPKMKTSYVTKYSEAYNDWIFFASYVNNFVRTAEVTECDDFDSINYMVGEADAFDDENSHYDDVLKLTVLTVRNVKASGVDQMKEDLYVEKCQKGGEICEPSFPANLPSPGGAGCWCFTDPDNDKWKDGKIDWTEDMVDME
jgi:hypothetical protein